MSMINCFGQIAYLTIHFVSYMQKHLADWFLWLLKSFLKSHFILTEKGEEGTRSARKDYNP